MNKITTVLIILFSITLSSCQTIAKKMYGIKKPQVETVESVEEYLSSINLQSDNNFYCKNFVTYKTVLKEFENSLPEAVLFNSEGKKLIYKKNNQDCNAGLFETIPGLTINSKLQLVDSINISTFIAYLVDRNDSSIIAFPKADYHLFINWAKYMGKLNKDHVKVWEELANKNQNSKIKVYKINMDIMKSWNVEP